LLLTEGGSPALQRHHRLGNIETVSQWQSRISDVGEQAALCLHMGRQRLICMCVSQHWDPQGSAAWCPLLTLLDAFASQLVRLRLIATIMHSFVLPRRSPPRQAFAAWCRLLTSTTTFLSPAATA
jgi:hypothetical protein